MSQGGVLQLVIKDEKFDKFFTASDYLRKRLDRIRQKRSQTKGVANIQPTFTDIEKSHILYLHAVYRPYVAVASEYAHVKAAGDSTAAISLSGGTLQFTFPVYGHFTSDMAIHARFRPVGSATATEPTTETPYYRFCALPGVRMFKKVELRSDNVLIDDYTPDDVIAASKFFVGADSRPAWERCHGQQDIREATYFGNGYTGNLTYSDGLQTPKLFHDSFDFYIPLQFDHCRDASRAMLNDLVANSQRTVTCELAPMTDIIQALVPAVGGLPPPAPGGAAPAPLNLTPVPLPFTKLAVEFDLYVNGLYVNPEIHDIYASRIGFSLTRVHRRQLSPIEHQSGEFLLSQLKFPTEYYTIGVRSRHLANDFDRWWMMGFPRVRSNESRLVVPAMIWNSTLNICQLVCREATESTTLDNRIDTIGVTASGVVIYPKMSAPFYNSYMPIRYDADSMVVSPSDESAFLVNFCLYPGQHNPSGYFNLSANRDMYVSYRLKTDITPGEAEMVFSASVLNFIVRRGDSISLRYSL